MNIEYEATFADIDKREIRQKLKSIGAELIKEEFLQKRSTWHVPKECKIAKSWLRVRDEDDKITLTFKSVGDGFDIEGQKEVELEVDNYKQAELFLKTIGCKKKSYQETKREIWKLDDVEIMIDEWPFLEPLVEIEGKNEEVVKNVSKKMGFDYNKAIFDCVSVLYSEKYGVPEDFVNHEVERIVFEEKNPFIEYKD